LPSFISGRGRRRKKEKDKEGVRKGGRGREKNLRKEE
jgi:hypothetical protein